MKSEGLISQDYEFDIYVPMTDNEGRGHDPKLIADFKHKLVEKFGGLTDTRYKNEGTWKTGRVVQRDEIVIWRALSQGEDLRNFMREIKKQMESALRQEEILVICREVTAL